MGRRLQCKSLKSRVVDLIRKSRVLNLIPESSIIAFFWLIFFSNNFFQQLSLIKLFNVFGLSFCFALYMLSQVV